jgi:hypothetical protein
MSPNYLLSVQSLIIKVNNKHILLKIASFHNNDIIGSTGRKYQSRAKSPVESESKKKSENLFIE